MEKYTKICILKGGTSTEREISLITARSFACSLTELGIRYVEIDFVGDLQELVSFLKTEKPSCVLNALHGGSGEDGHVQALLDILRIPYTHSGVSASSVSMNKQLSKRIFADCGLNVPQGKVICMADVENCLNNAEFPVVIKPVSEGSSVGVHIIDNIDEVKNIKWNYGKYAIFEKYIPGVELSVGVLDGKPMAVTKISVSSGFYDYSNKYTNGGSYHEVPAKIPSLIYEEALVAAAIAHASIGCRGVSRSDFRYDPVEDKLYILEINNQPGMTPNSLVPEQAKYIGISFNQLVKIMVDKACFDM